MLLRIWQSLVVLVGTLVGVGNGGVPVACRSPGAGMVEMGGECFRWRRLASPIQLGTIATACADEAATEIPYGGVPGRLHGFTTYHEIIRFFVPSSLS